MTTTEFSNEFDILYNNITSNQAPGLDEYEKSVFLTRAQEDILKGYFNPKTNKIQEGFDSSEQRQINFANLIKFDSSVTVNAQNEASISEEIFAILNEKLIVTRRDNPVELVVRPLTYTEYDRLLSKPYKRPPKYHAWRIIQNNKCKFIIGSEDTISEYHVRYVRKPNPIILENLSNGLKINDLSEETPCELDESLHREILQRAVELAKATYEGTLADQVTLGQTSQTNLGIISQNK